MPQWAVSHLAPANPALSSRSLPRNMEYLPICLCFSVVSYNFLCTVPMCVLQLNCRSVLQSEHMFPLSDMACHLTLSLYEAQWVEPKLLSLEWIRCFLGTSFLTTLSPSTTVRRSKTLSQDGLVLFFLLPVDTSRASPLNPSHNVSDEHPSYWRHSFLDNVDIWVF